MSEKKFKVSVIDFMPHYGKFEVGRDKNDKPVCLGDTVIYMEEEWLVAYRYGDYVLKKIGLMAMFVMKDGFGKVEKINTFTAGPDWLLIGYTNEPLFERLKHLFDENT